MGNYLMQLDPSGNCCNCPDRNTPCENCPGGCPSLTSISVEQTISGTCSSGIVYSSDTTAFLDLTGIFDCSSSHTVDATDNRLVIAYRTCGATTQDTFITIDVALTYNGPALNTWSLTMNVPLALVLGNGNLGACGACVGISISGSTESVGTDPRGSYTYSYSSGGITLAFNITIV